MENHIYYSIAKEVIGNGAKKKEEILVKKITEFVKGQ